MAGLVPDQTLSGTFAPTAGLKSAALGGAAHASPNIADR